MDQESRWYSMFKGLNQNFMKIRITLVVEEVVAVGEELARARAARLLEDEPLANFLTSAPEYWGQVAGSTCACRLLRGRQGECVLVKLWLGAPGWGPRCVESVAQSSIV